jgi:hypothetical protein
VLRGVNLLASSSTAAMRAVGGKVSTPGDP